ncbi:hypothetical protein SEA_PEPE25_47 [Microbacterium phage Pepe25]|nr:hypothetical protein SEA_PEPE25_47 [Microbacterium phage Pepe25]
MMCILHHLAPNSSGPEQAGFVLFGLSLCPPCAEALSVELVKGASVRDVLAAARAGHW